MTGQESTKLNQVLRDLPEGLVVDSLWLEARGISRQLRSHYVSAGWLQRLHRSVYARLRGPLSWQQVVVSLQTLLLRSPLTVGGLSALELHGLTHYLAATPKEVHLHGPKPPPPWVNRLGLPQTFVHHNDARLFRNDPIHSGLTSLAWDIPAGTGRNVTEFRGGGFEEMAWGLWEWPLTLSTPERAMLEYLDELPDHGSFDDADKIMQGLANLSPRRVEKLLADCTSVKTKRLFLFFADRHRHGWLRHLDRSRIDLGSGKRMLVRGGRLDVQYGITVPRDLDRPE